MATWKEIQIQFEQDVLDMKNNIPPLDLPLIQQYTQLLNTKRHLQLTNMWLNTLEPEYGLFEIKEYAYLFYLEPYKKQYFSSDQKVLEKFLRSLQIKYNELLGKNGLLLQTSQKKIEYINVIILLEVILEEFTQNFDSTKLANFLKLLKSFKSYKKSTEFDYLKMNSVAFGFAKFIVTRGFNYKEVL